MLGFTDDKIVLDPASLKAKSEAYLVEQVVQRLTDLYLARYGERILAEINADELVQAVKAELTKRLHENV